MKVVVYGASSSAIAEDYLAAGRQLGRLLGRNGITAVTGGGRAGEMAAVIDGQIDTGMESIGVLPRFMVRKGWAHPGLKHTIVTDTMHERKAAMLRLADGGAIALPGGIGTYEELLEAITWRQLGLYTAPVVVVNIGGYYDSLLSQIAQAESGGFMRSCPRELFFVARSADEAVDIILSQWNGRTR